MSIIQRVKRNNALPHSVRAQRMFSHIVIGVCDVVGHSFTSKQTCK